MATSTHYAEYRSPQFASRASSWRLFTLLPAAGLLWALWMQQQGLPTSYYQTWSGFVLVAALVAATLVDLAHHKIPNYVTYPAWAWLASLSLLQFVVHTADGGEALSIGAARWVGILGAQSIADYLTGFGACFGVMFLLFACGAGGGGDVKLAAVIGGALGAVDGLTALVVAHIVAGTFALALAVVKYGPVAVFGLLGRKIGSVFFPVWILPPDREAARLLATPVPLSPFFLVGVGYAVWQMA